LISLAAKENRFRWLPKEKNGSFRRFEPPETSTKNATTAINLHPMTTADHHPDISQAINDRG
jgi:hypothetical protein